MIFHGKRNGMPVGLSAHFMLFFVEDFSTTKLFWMKPFNAYVIKFYYVYLKYSEAMETYAIQAWCIQAIHIYAFGRQCFVHARNFF